MVGGNKESYPGGRGKTNFRGNGKHGFEVVQSPFLPLHQTIILHFGPDKKGEKTPRKYGETLFLKLSQLKAILHPT